MRPRWRKWHAADAHLLDQPALAWVEDGQHTLQSHPQATVSGVGPSPASLAPLPQPAPPPPEEPPSPITASCISNAAMGKTSCRLKVTADRPSVGIVFRCRTASGKWVALPLTVPDYSFVGRFTVTLPRGQEFGNNFVGTIEYAGRPNWTWPVRRAIMPPA